MTVTITATGQTDLGRVRTNNEDALLIGDLVRGESAATRIALLDGQGALFAVSDGMGGENAGEVASVMALEVMRGRLPAYIAASPPHEALRRSIEDAHTAVRTEGVRDASRRGMGATLTAALVHGASAYVAEVGDSRAYLVRRGSITQVTHDQSYVQVLLDAKAITAEQAADSPMKNVILQALGKEEKVDVAMTGVALRNGDRLLLCTDGLSNKMSSAEMLEGIERGMNLGDTCAALIRLANERGAEDNVTLVCIAVDGDLPAARDDEALASTFKVLSEFHARNAP
jgi:serine/threonine protein phosphatase PrpC